MLQAHTPAELAPAFEDLVLPRRSGVRERAQVPIGPLSYFDEMPKLHEAGHRGPRITSAGSGYFLAVQTDAQWEYGRQFLLSPEPGPSGDWQVVAERGFLLRWGSDTGLLRG